MYKKRSKFGNIKTHGFDSKKEAQRYTELSLMQKAGLIHDLKCQQVYELLPSQRIDGKVVERPVQYVADFVYTTSDGNAIVEDVKGYRSKEYIIKRKMMLYLKGIRIKEV